MHKIHVPFFLNDTKIYCDTAVKNSYTECVRFSRRPFITVLTTVYHEAIALVVFTCVILKQFGNNKWIPTLWCIYQWIISTDWWEIIHWRLSLHRTQGLYSLSGRTSYRKISRSLEAARFWFRLLQSLWNLTDTSAARLQRCLSNFRAIRSL